MKSLVKKVVFGALFLMNVGLVFAHPPVDPPEDVVPPRVIEIAEELHEEIVSPFEKRKAEKKSELECKFKEECRVKIHQISRCTASQDSEKLKAVSDDFESWQKRRKAELDLELKNYYKEIDSEFKDKLKKGEIEIKWDSFRSYNNFKPMTFTTDIPQCVLDTNALKYKNFCPENGCVVYGYCKEWDWFKVTSMFDMLVRGPEYSRSGMLPAVRASYLQMPTCLLLDEKTCDFIRSKQPGWKPSSTFTLDECFNISVDYPSQYQSHIEVPDSSIVKYFNHVVD